MDAAKLGLHLLNQNDVLYGRIDVEVITIFSEFARLNLGKIEHVINEEVENLWTRIHNFDALIKLIFNLDELSFDFPRRKTVKIWIGVYLMYFLRDLFLANGLTLNRVDRIPHLVWNCGID